MFEKLGAKIEGCNGQHGKVEIARKELSIPRKMLFNRTRTFNINMTSMFHLWNIVCVRKISDHNHRIAAHFKLKSCFITLLAPLNIPQNLKSHFGASALHVNQLQIHYKSKNKLRTGTHRKCFKQRKATVLCRHPDSKLLASHTWLNMLLKLLFSSNDITINTNIKHSEPCE